jgi:predicted AlkP superfamily phosphohydrolase/phosphomutase
VAARTEPQAELLVLALDACDADLMRELASTGDCPNLARLLEEGAVVDTVAPYGTFVGSSWMTITTGVGVESHRYWNWVEVDRETYALRPTTPRESKRPAFWQAMSDAGRRVAVLDVPHADVPERFDGVLVKEWGCHDRHHGTASHPPELCAELDELVGRHPFGSMDDPLGTGAFAPCDYTLRAGRHRTRDEDRQLHEALLHGARVKQAASLEVLGRGPWDVFVSVHGESHCVGHQLWHLHDEGHPRHDPATRALLGDSVVAVYRELDASIGAHLARAGDDATVWVLMNHGMGPHFDGDHLLDEILRRLDPRLDAHRGGRITAATGPVLTRLPTPARRIAQRAVAAAVRRRADAAPPPLAMPTGPSPERSFFPIPGNTTVGAVRLNLVGRESQGVVDRADLPALQEKLIDQLLQVVNLDTGCPAVRAVVPSDEVLERSEDDGLPDLFVEWDRRALMERVWSPHIGTVAAPYLHWRTGDHHDRGMVIVRAPGVQPGVRTEPMALVDVAPTLCAAVGVDLPGTEGVVHLDLLPPGASTARPTDTPRTGSKPLRALGREPLTRPHRDAPSVLDSTLDLGVETARRVAELERRVAEQQHAVQVERARLEGAAAQLEATTAQLDATTAQLDATTAQLGAATARLGAAEARVDALERERAIRATTLWLAQEPVVDGPLVSIVTPTHRRPEKLRRAIESVLAQRYPRWELVVIDDGDDSAKGVVAEAGDERIVYHQVRHGGASAARNVALDIASGSIITYLDDDNTLDPVWLHAVTWAFGLHPEHDVLYGARVFDDEERTYGRGSGGFPWMQFEPYDRDHLEQHNMADMGVIAHRAGIPGARFDEELWECGDWDFFLSITEDRDPLMLPVVAFYYRTDGTDRLTGRFEHHADIVRQKWAARRTERVAPADDRNG